MTGTENINENEQSKLSNKKDKMGRIDRLDKIIDGLTENLLAMVIIIPSVIMAYEQIALPDWQIAAVGAILAYYFTKHNASSEISEIPVDTKV